MSLITENFHDKKLKKYNINIKTKYKVNDKILERNTDNSINDDVINGIRLEKKYYKDGYLIGKVSNFDPRVHYTYVFKEEENKDTICPNCGKTGTTKEFINGCPYCNTYYNIDYINKELGTKEHLDNIMHNEKYNKITFIIDLIISFILVFIYIKTHGRTFNIYDISKIVVGSLILGFSLYYIFYMLDALIVLLPIKIYKNKMNQKQIEFWNNAEKNNISKKTFFNNFNYELQRYYYLENEDIIDYDIIDYLDFELINKEETIIKVTINIRIIKYINNKINKKIENKQFILKKNKQYVDELKGGINIIKCHNCGASIDVNKDTCEYCKTKINYMQEWYLIK